MQKNWQLRSQEEELVNPSHSTIRDWLGRVGLYELNRDQEKEVTYTKELNYIKKRTQKFSREISPEKRNIILDYLVKQTAVIKDDTSFLATSALLESLFGKYKFFSRRCPLQELGRMILTIPLATVNFTVDLIKEALETITSVDVKAWEEQLFGSSTLSKRKRVFSSP